MQRTPTSSLRGVDRSPIPSSLGSDTRRAQELSQEFMRALADTGGTSDGTEMPAYTRDLNSALVTYVRELRDLALPPERVIVRVKELANRSVDNAGRSALAWPLEARRHFMADVVLHCIRAYYQVD
jgi:hypothetical protein